MQTQNIHSYVRLRPEQGQPVLHVESDQKTVSINKYNDRFQFERAFDQQTTNSTVYEHVGAELIKSALEGYNCCIFAYGQTSSGKTHTIRGSDKEQGLIKLALADVFGRDKSKIQIQAIINYMEIYNQTINDLLNTQNQNLSIRDDGNKNTIIEDLTERKCQTFAEALECLEKGETNRKYGSTEMNGQSSRSHCVFRIKLKIKQKNYAVKTSTINIIDLAGSECISKTKAEGLAKKQGENINKSLLFLSNVIRGLSQKQHVNYRDSKLTRILQSSLSGNSKTSVICTINCSALNSAQTINTLKFGVSAGQVKLKPKINQERKSLSPLKSKSPYSKEITSSAEKDKQNHLMLLNRASQQLQDLKTKHSQVTDQNEQLQKIIDRQAKDIEILNHNLTHSKNEKMVKQESLHTLSITNRRQQQLIERLNAKISKLEQELSKEREEAQSIKSTIIRLRNQNSIHQRNQEQFHETILKIKKQKLEIEKSIKDEKMKMVSFKQKFPSFEHTPYTLQSMMNHTIQMLEKNKEINYLKERIKYMQQQAAGINEEDDQIDEEDKVERCSKRRIRKMKNTINKARRQDQKNCKILVHCNARIVSLERQLLQYELTENLNNEHGAKILEYLEFTGTQKDQVSTQNQ